MAKGDIVTSSHRFRGPCSACGDGDTALKYHHHDPLPPSYTLADLRALAAQYADERHCEAKLTIQLSLGCFVEWLAKREQGKGSDNVR